MTRALISNGLQVTIGTVEKARASEPMLRLQTDFPTLQIVTVPYSTRISSLDSIFDVASRELHAWFLLKRIYSKAVEHEAPHLVLLPYLDHCLHIIGLAGSPFARTPWVTVTMRPTFHFHTMGIHAPRTKIAWFRRLAFLKMIKNPYLRKCLTIDPTLAEFVSTKWPKVSHKIEYLPDPVRRPNQYSAEHARTALGIPLDQNVILVYGSITNRKGISTLLNALQSPELSPKTTALLVGKVHTGVRHLLFLENTSRLLATGRLRILDQWADEALEGLAFSAADIVWLVYDKHWQSSAVQIQAMMMRLPMLATSDGLIGWISRKFNVGLTVTKNNDVAVVRDLNELIRKKEALRTSMECISDQIRTMHSLKNASEMVVRSLISNDPTPAY